MNNPSSSGINSAKYNKRIQIQQEGRTWQLDGGYQQSWSVLPGCNSVPANILYPPPSKKGDEQYTQNQVHSSVFTTMTIRYRPSLNIDASMRIVYGTRVFNIRTVLPVDEAKREIVLQCQEVQAKGTLH